MPCYDYPSIFGAHPEVFKHSKKGYMYSALVDQIMTSGSACRTTLQNFIENCRNNTEISRRTWYLIERMLYHNLCGRLAPKNSGKFKIYIRFNGARDAGMCFVVRTCIYPDGYEDREVLAFDDFNQFVSGY